MIKREVPWMVFVHVKMTDRFVRSFDTQASPCQIKNALSQRASHCLSLSCPCSAPFPPPLTRGLSDLKQQGPFLGGKMYCNDASKAEIN